MISLHEGKYPNEGHVEIYCNGQCGTLYHVRFDSNDAQTICKQLGYYFNDSFRLLNVSIFVIDIHNTIVIQ